MNKYLLIILPTLLLAACADKDQYQQAVLEQMQKEQDIKDYKIAPEYMTDCVVELSSQKMPGLFDLDPERMTAYRNYTKLLNLLKSQDPKKTMEELRTDFGSPKAVADAHANYTESLLECYTTVISKSEQEQKEQEPETENKQKSVDGQPATSEGLKVLEEKAK